MSFFEFFVFGMGVFVIFIIPLYAYVYFSVRKNIFRLAKIADEIFLAFGFDDPPNFDLIKTTENHQRLHNIPLNAKTRFHLWY